MGGGGGGGGGGEDSAWLGDGRESSCVKQPKWAWLRWRTCLGMLSTQRLLEEGLIDMQDSSGHGWWWRRHRFAEKPLDLVAAEVAIRVDSLTKCVTTQQCK